MATTNFFPPCIYLVFIFQEVEYPFLSCTSHSSSEKYTYILSSVYLDLFILRDLFILKATWRMPLRGNLKNEKEPVWQRVGKWAF